MSKRLLTILSLFCVMFAMTASSVLAQNLRPEETLFIKPRVGISSYLGDNEKSPTNFNLDMYKIDGKLPYNVALELGYQFSVPFSVSLAYQLGNYPIITQFGEEEGADLGIDDDPTIRHTVALFGRYTFAGATTKVAPYINFGAAASFGDAVQFDATQPGNRGAEESGSAFGPLLGLGLDIALNDRTSFFLEANSAIHLSDDLALDGYDQNGFGSADVLTGIGLGLKINFKAAFTPIEVFSVDCPAQLLVGESGTFTAATNDDIASQPVEYRWDYGDGGTGSGMSSTHSYSQSGTYTVTFTANNGGDPATRTCSVRVIQPAEIVTITSNKNTVSICDPDRTVNFSANTRGDAPLTYSWDMGDGSAPHTGATPTHTYETPGTYTVTLTLTNSAGSDTESMTITVTDEGCFDCNISQMNSVFFDRNSSVLTEQGRQLLQENLTILENCPNICVRLDGYASRDERNPQRLSEDRARAVEQFYLDNGIAASRIATQGLGAQGQTTKKGGASQFRRVDTIPMPCDDMMEGGDDM